MTGTGAPGGWLRPRPFDGSAASLAEHADAVRAAARGEGRLWLGPFPPPARLDPSLAGTALVVPTSGSTGAAKAVTHTRRTLRASQDATAALFAADGTAPGTAGHGYWVPLLPPTHIAGVQVLARAQRTAEVHGLDRPALPRELPALAAHFDASRFVAVAAPALVEAAGLALPAFTSLVPTQLARLVEGTTGAEERARELLRRFAAVLVGGAATAPGLLRAARALDLPVRTTYGSSETAGGCVYDGVPLPGVELDVEDPDHGVPDHRVPDHRGRPEYEGRLLVATPALTPGYLAPDGSALDGGIVDRGGRRTLVTSDLGHLDADGHLTVRGRADDVLVTGGRKVLPQDVERAVLTAPPLAGLVADVVVVGVADAEWGQRVVALVRPTPRSPATPAGTADRLPALVRAALQEGDLPRHAVPREVHVVAELPTLGIGKPDRTAAARLAADLP